MEESDLGKTDELRNLEEEEEQFCLLDRTRSGLLILIFVSYFNHGGLTFLKLNVQYFAKDLLGLSPSETQLVVGSISWPWLPKFLYGFWTDSLPICRYRRRPYIFIICTISVISYAIIGCCVKSTALLLLLLVFSQFGLAFNDVIVDGLVVEASQEKSKRLATNFQTCCVVSSSIGVIVTSFGGGFLIESIGPNSTFFVILAMPVMIIMVACIIIEKPTDIKIECKTIITQISLLMTVFKDPCIWKPCLFIFLLFGMPNVDQGYFFFVTNELKIEKSFMGFVNGSTGIAGLVGALIFNCFLSHVPFKKMFIFVSICMSLLGLLQLVLVFRWNITIGLSDKVFLISSKAVNYVGLNLLKLTMFVFAARICPKNIEGTLFATIMGIHNLADILSDYGGAAMMKLLNVTETNFDDLWIGILICQVCSLLPLFFLKFVPSNLERSKIGNESEPIDGEQVTIVPDEIQLLESVSDGNIN